MVSKNDFKFDSIVNGEYYFLVKGKTQEELNSKFSDMGFRFVNAVVYTPIQDTIKTECFYIFNVMYYEFEDKVIKEIVKQMYKESKR